MKKRKGRWQVWPGETFTVTWDDGSSTEFPRYVDFHGQRLNFEDLRRRVQAGMR